MTFFDSHLWDGFVGAFLGTIGAFGASWLLIRHESVTGRIVLRAEIVKREIEHVQFAMRQVSDAQTGILKALDDQPDQLHFAWRVQIEVLKIQLLLPRLEPISTPIFESTITSLSDVVDFLSPDDIDLEAMVAGVLAYYNSLGPTRTALGALLNQKEHDLLSLS